MSTRVYPPFDDGTCEFINTSTPVPPPPSRRPLCRLPCLYNFERLFKDNVVGIEEGKRFLQKKKSSSDATPAERKPPTKLPQTIVERDDVGTRTRRKVPFVRDNPWDVWDKNSPTYDTYELLGVQLRSNIYPGWTYNYGGRFGTTQLDYNEEPFRRRHPMTDKWRMRRDEMTMWAELDVVGKALLREWNLAYGLNGFKRKQT